MKKILNISISTKCFLSLFTKVVKESEKISISIMFEKASSIDVKGNSNSNLCLVWMYGTDYNGGWNIVEYCNKSSY